MQLSLHIIPNVEILNVNHAIQWLMYSSHAYNSYISIEKYVKYFFCDNSLKENLKTSRENPLQDFSKLQYKLLVKFGSFANNFVKY